MTYTKIKDLKVGETVSQVFLIADIESRTTKKGKPYGRLLLTDKDSRFNVNVWDFEPKEYPEIQAGGFVSMAVEVQDYRGEKSGVSKGIPLPVDAPEDITSYVDDRGLTDEEADNYYQLLMEYKDLVQDPMIKAYLDTIFLNKETETKFKIAPASASNRGAYKGGLVEHVYKVMLNADHIVQAQLTAHNPPSINEDIVIAGVLTHDLGKMYAYDVDHTGAKTTKSGRLLGHLVPSYGISVQAFIATESAIRRQVPDSIKDHIHHCILSHHGKLEYGSPVTPMSIEAMIVHQADIADGSVSNFAEPITDQADEVDANSMIRGSRFFNSSYIYIDEHDEKFTSR